MNADERLRAAAPDMYEALQLASISCGFNKLNTVAQKRIRAALAKASGELPDRQPAYPYSIDKEAPRWIADGQGFDS